MTIHKQYRYKHSTTNANVALIAIPPTGETARQFATIARALYWRVCQLHSGHVVFYHPDQAVNRKRARFVTAIWRELTHTGGGMTLVDKEGDSVELSL